jgi:hypothetical protein
LSAFAAPGQIRAAVYEDAPLFASQADPAVGPSIRQGVRPMFRLWHKWLSPQWSVGHSAAGPPGVRPRVGFTYRVFEDMPHSMHGHDPATYVATVTAWADELALTR